MDSEVGVQVKWPNGIEYDGEWKACRLKCAGLCG